VHRMQSIWVSQVGYWDLKSREAGANYLEVSGTACNVQQAHLHIAHQFCALEIWSSLELPASAGVFSEALRAQRDAKPLRACMQTMQEALDRGIQKLVIITVPTAVRTLQRLVAPMHRQCTCTAPPLAIEIFHSMTCTARSAAAAAHSMWASTRGTPGGGSCGTATTSSGGGRQTTPRGGPSSWTWTRCPWRPTPRLGSLVRFPQTPKHRIPGINSFVYMPESRCYHTHPGPPP
jgi:hypothetical protein